MWQKFEMNLEAIEKYGYPLVIKPIDGNHGKGNTTNIINREQALKAFEAAKVYGRNVIQHPKPKGITQALMAMVHDGASVKKALSLIK